MASPTAEQLALVAAVPFAALGTHGADGAIDLVPCCFAVVGALDPGPVELVTAVDHKPKRHRRLARLANIERRPEATILVDHRDAADWSALWWARISGPARVVDDGPEHRRAIDALVAKYEQYQLVRPAGPVIAVRARRWLAWSAADSMDDDGG
ncbi:MAG: TIGR03668 family PPOX class F420-dependent oxidoreductase [Acidimicrobiales bacterium]